MWRIFLAQCNPTVGDFRANRDRILGIAADIARATGQPKAGDHYLIVFPELVTSGYPPLDLLERGDFNKICALALADIARAMPQGYALALGSILENPRPRGKALTDSLLVFEEGRQVFRQDKSLLPTYDVFDESRYFEAAQEHLVWDFHGLGLAFPICEDIWMQEVRDYTDDPLAAFCKAGAQVLIVPSASPFHVGKREQRFDIARGAVHRYGLPLLYVNTCGANDALIFDGRSFAMARDGSLVTAMAWEEGWTSIVIESETSSGSLRLSADEGRPALDPLRLRSEASYPKPEEETEEAILCGLHDFVRKCGFSKVLLGLSGGIDSALVAALAVKALGPDKVLGLSMPSRFSSEGSRGDAQALAKNLGMQIIDLPIEAMYESVLTSIAPHFAGTEAGIAEENIQARLRGLSLMAFANKFGFLLLATGNKSELATGYCTLYGDMCGGLCPIGDVYKTEVWALARYINAKAGYALIPQSSIDKVPSAELRFNQKDEDSLPPYEILDQILRLYIEDNLSETDLVASGFEAATVARVIGLVIRAEFKRRQAAPVLKISRRAFGLGRLYPIACAHPKAW